MPHMPIVWTERFGKILGPPVRTLRRNDSYAGSLIHYCSTRLQLAYVYVRQVTSRGALSMARASKYYIIHRLQTVPLRPSGTLSGPSPGESIGHWPATAYYP